MFLLSESLSKIDFFFKCLEFAKGNRLGIIIDCFLNSYETI